MKSANRTISCPPKIQRRRIIAGMGTSPAVLTETVRTGFGIILRKEEG